jgi:hypothetical protein
MGGSESRFVMGPSNDPEMRGKPTQCLMSKTHSYGERITLGPRDVYNRYQKFRIQSTEGGSYIRFDDHPQPGIRTTDKGTVELYNAGWDKRGEWVLSVLADHDGARWHCPYRPDKFNGDLSADNMQNIPRLRVCVYNPNADAWLSVDEKGNIVMRTFKFDPDDEKLKDMKYIRSMNLMWELNYTNSQWSKGDVSLAVMGPVAVAGLIVGGVALGPLAGPALFAQFGFAAVPAIQLIGATSLSAASATTMALGTAFCTKVLKLHKFFD